MLSSTAMFSGMVSLFLFSSNPSLLIVWLVLVSILVGVILNLQAGSWIFFAVVLLFTGGMMVLFSYMLTLVSSNKVIFNFSWVSLVSAWTLLLVIKLFWGNMAEGFFTISTLFSLSQVSVLAFLAAYLFVVLMTVVKLALNFSGPLKSFISHEL